MYENHWNLREKPFRNFNDKKFFFYSETYEEAYLRLLYNITESQGLFLLLGDSGCGKSYLGKIFMQDMIEQGYRVAFINNPTCSPNEFLQQVLYEFGINAINKTKLELLQELKKFLETLQNGKSSILIIDEAHLIEDTKTVEEIRLLLNFEANNRFLLIPILLGKPEMGEMIFKSSLKERVAMQYCLSPLTCHQTGEYIYYRLNKAGLNKTDSSQEIFTPETVRDIYTITGGIPREINRVCDLALLLGYGENSKVVDSALIRKAVENIKGSVRVK